MLRLKGIRYCSIVARGSLKTLASFLNIECKKYKNLETKCVTTSPGLPYCNLCYSMTLSFILGYHAHSTGVGNANIINIHTIYYLLLCITILYKWSPNYIEFGTRFFVLNVDLLHIRCSSIVDIYRLL